MASDETSLFSGSCDMSIALIGRLVFVAPVVTSNSAPEIPVTVEPEVVYTISKYQINPQLEMQRQLEFHR